MTTLKNYPAVFEATNMQKYNARILGGRGGEVKRPRNC